MERVHEVLRRDVPRRVRGEGAAAEPADRRVENGRARCERRERIRVAGVPRVVEMAADRDSELDRAPDQRAHGAWCRYSDRVGEDERVGAALGDARCRLHDAFGIDLALERAAERDAQRHRRAEAVRTSARDDAPGSLDGLLDGRALVPLVERFGDAECEANLVEPRRDEPLVAALVEREPGPHYSRHHSDGRDDLLRTGHLRHTSRVDEARDLDRGHPRSGDASNQLRPRSYIEDLRLVLETVAWPDVVHDDVRRTGHRRTLSPL